MLPSVYVLDTILFIILEGQTLFWHRPTFPQYIAKEIAEHSLNLI